MATSQRREHCAYLLLLECGDIDVFGRRRRLAERAEHAVQPAAAIPAPQFVEPQANRGTVQPSFGPVAMRTGIRPPLQEDVDRQFLRAGLVVNDTADHAGDALVVRAEDPMQFGRVGRVHLARGGHALCVHTPRTLEAVSLWQALSPATEPLEARAA